MHLKMALVAENNVYVQPQAYFGVCHSHLPALKLESGTCAAQIDTWSKLENGTSVSKINAEGNTVEMTNGKTFSYKALVLAPGFNHSMDYIKGLETMEKTPDSEGMFVHMLDSKERTFRNFWNGWHNPNGDMICYSPKAPYKGEGSDFYALYYEHFMRQDKMHYRAANNARVQFWTPNKEIYQFGYANEVALDECHKRGIDVMFGWEMLEVKVNEHGQKIAVFKNVDNGDLIEKDFFSANINPPSKPHQFLIDSGITDAQGGIDVNKHTLQHNKHENIFAFGDAVGFNTTRTQTAAMAQNPIVKNNLLRFLQGKEVNGIYDGYTFMPFLLGHSYASNFQHLHDFEPAPLNHAIPHYGIFSNLYFTRMMTAELKAGTNYSSFKKDHGPPYGYWPAEYDELEHCEYLQSHNLTPEDVRHPAAQARIDSGVTSDAPAITH